MKNDWSACSRANWTLGARSLQPRSSEGPFAWHDLAKRITDHGSGLSPRMVGLVTDLVQDWRRLDERIAAVSAEIAAVTRAACRMKLIAELVINLKTAKAIRFRHFIDGSLALASLNHACRDHRPNVSATLTTMAFDHSSLRWLEINT